MSPMMRLEQMGYRFRLEGDKVMMRCYGEPPAEAQELINRLDKEQVRRVLHDREAGFSAAPAGIIWAYGDEIMPTAQRIRAALDAGELWDIFVKYSKRADCAEFHFWPAEWSP